MTHIIRYASRRIREFFQYADVRRRLAAISEFRNPILLIGHELKLSGASMLMIRFANELCSKGRTVILLINDGCMMEQAAVSRLDKRIVLFQLHASTPAAAALLAGLQQRGCNKCVANTVVTGLFADALEQYGFKVVWLIHEMACSCKILQAEPLVNKILRVSSAVVFPDRSVQESFLSLSTGTRQPRMELLPQAIYKDLQTTAGLRAETRRNLAKQFSIPEDSVLLTGAGAVNFGKGVDLLVPTLTALLEKNNVFGRDYHMMWIGGVREDDPYVIWLKRQIEAAGLKDRWHWSGFVADDAQYASLLCATDIFLLPSREDSYPSVMLEAQYLDIPTLAFEGSGGGASMAAEQHGCVAKASSIQDLCQHIERFASKPDYLKEQVACRGNTLRQKGCFSAYVDSVVKMF